MWHKPKSAPTNPQYALISGRAYPDLIKGKNSTTRVKASQHDREAFYRDDAVRLSDEYMSEIDGAIGAPLCYEHRRNDVVGEVTHSWVDEGAGRYMHINARIPLNDRGKKIVDKIRRGKITGFSVGYATRLVEASKKNVREKNFYEISLVKEPFFDGCHLTVGVLASDAAGAGVQHQHHQDTGKSFWELVLSTYKSKPQTSDDYIYAPFDMSDAPAIPAPTQVSPAAAPAGGSIMPPNNQNEAAERLLTQNDNLARDLAEFRKKEKDLADKLAEQDKRLAFYAQKEAEEANAYKQAQMPKAEEYIRTAEEQTGKPLTEVEKKQYISAFTNPRFKADADRLYAQHEHHVKVTASKKEAEENLKKLRDENMKLAETLAKAAKGVSNMRSTFADVVDVGASKAAPQHESLPDSNRRDTHSAPAAGELAEIMCSRPSPIEEYVLKELGFLGGAPNIYGEVHVNASRAGDNGGLVRSVLAARDHRTGFVDGDMGGAPSAGGMRDKYPHIFGWYANESGLLDRNVRLDRYAALDKDHNLIDETRREA